MSVAHDWHKLGFLYKHCLRRNGRGKKATEKEQSLSHGNLGEGEEGGGGKDEGTENAGIDVRVTS